MGKRKNEQMGVDFNVYVGGFGLLGVSTDATAPDIQLTGIESDSSSAGKLSFYYGAVDNIETEFTVGAQVEEVHKEMGKLNEGVIIFKEYLSEGKVGEGMGVEYHLHGQISAVTSDKIKRGEKKALVIKMGSCHYYKKMIDGKVVCEIDKINSICKLNGQKDLLEESRNFVLS